MTVGLARKPDYLTGLGVTAIWLLPFYPSPLRDDGYDIADYMSVNRRSARCATSATWSARRSGAS